MDILIVLVMSRFGNIESHSVKCDYQILCNFDIKITKDMMPESKVVVYSVVDEKTMLHGETVIKTQELGANTVRAMQLVLNLSGSVRGRLKITKFSISEPFPLPIINFM